MGTERVHEVPISIQIKIYLWSFVDYQHLQKYFHNWNITLNYCVIYIFHIRGNFIWTCPWSGFRKVTFFKKRAPKMLPLPCYSIPFWNALHRNKALYNCCKTWQHSIIQRNICLEYALLVASNSHVSITLSHPHQSLNGKIAFK